MSLLFPVEVSGKRRAGVSVFSPLAFCLFASFLAIYILPPPLPMRPEYSPLDSSWQIELTKAFLNGAQFGRDIIYSYGPWGFLQYPRGDARIYPWLVFGRLLIGIAFVFGLTSLAQRHIRRSFLRIAFVIVTALVADPVYVLPILLFSVFFSGRRNALVHLLAIACALTVWIKFTSLVTVGALAVVVAFDDIRRRRFPVIGVEISAFALAFWVLAGQSLSGLGAFLHGALSTAISYSSEMSAHGSILETRLAFVLIAALALHCSRYMGGRLDLHRLAAASWLMLLFALQLKEAFIRHDSFHIWMGLVNALIPSCFILLCVTEPPNWKRFRNLPALAAVAASLAIVEMQIPSLVFVERMQILMSDVEGLGQLLSGVSPTMQLRQQIAAFKRAKPLPAVSGTAGLFPDYQAMLYANDENVVLSPVPQGFAAYNAYLSGLNANFYRSSWRPGYLFFDVSPIDGRYPSATDALSWRAFLDCYSPQGEADGYLLLRASDCRRSKLEPLNRVETRFGIPVSVPRAEGYGIWVEFEPDQSPMSKLAAIITKPPVFQMVVETASGNHTFRMTAETGRTGFLLSPYVVDRQGFADLYAGAPGDTVDRMTILDPDASTARIPVRYYRFELPRNAATR